MIIAKQYSHKEAHSLIDPGIVQYIDSCIKNIAIKRSKLSKEASKVSGTTLYSPVELNKAIKVGIGLKKHRVALKSPDGHRGFQELDGLLARVAIEVQFGKYAFMGYDILSKFPIFKSLGIIDYGIEIVPTKVLAKDMSTGVSYFEQIAAVLYTRGEADIDVPTLILGIQ